MSGNPFRASIVPPHPSTAPPTSFIDTDVSEAPEPPTERDSDAVLTASSTLPVKTKKTVRITSPTEIIPPHPAFHHGDESPLSPTNHNRYAGPLSPTSPAAFSDSAEDITPNDNGRTGEVEARGLTTGSMEKISRPEAVHSSSFGAPANPFSKTLASIEPQETSGEWAGQTKDRTIPETMPPGTPKASLDVESFKNLLMTGITSPRSSATRPPPQTVPATAPVSASVFENSSSTDTSSVSRQSIFEPVQESHPESPGTSYDMAASDEDKISLVGEVKKEKKKPPPAPKHRHGKLVTARTPQTVSFSGFSVAEPTTSPPPSVKRTNSDLNKPLPPTPPIYTPSTHIISQNSTHDTPSISDARSSETASLSDATPQKKVPPPVPLTRRHSQLRSSTAGNRSRSNSALTMSSQHSTEFPQPSPSPSQESISSPLPHKATPPPPPSRHRGAALATISTSSADSSSTELTSSAATRRPNVSSPNPPSSRRTTLSSDPPSPALDLARTSSMRSNRNLNPNRSTSNESSGPAMPPPPPPPRRRHGSGRSSLDKERPSIVFPSTSPSESRRKSSEKRNSVDSKRRTSAASESSLKYEYAPATENENALYSPKEERSGSSAELEGLQEVPSANSILDDMDRFQKEIDELREKYKQAA